MIPKLCRSSIPWFPRFPVSILPRFPGSRLPQDCTSWNRSKVRTQGPCSAVNSMPVQELAKHLKLIWTLHLVPSSLMQTFFMKLLSRTCFMNFGNPTFRGWQGFTEFPNISPSGKWVDSDDPFPRKPTNSGKLKNVTLGMLEWTRVLHNSRNSRIEARSWECPLFPYK
jgi:hypothetical protein